MGLKKVAVTNLKLKVGAHIQGYLLASEIKTLQGEDGAFNLCKVIIQEEKLGPTAVWLQGDYGHVLIKGLMTRIEKKTIKVDGEDKTVTDVEQDADDKITL